MSDIKELKDEELEKVVGGESANTLVVPKFADNENIHFKYLDYIIPGTIVGSSWDCVTEQFVYKIYHGETHVSNSGCHNIVIHEGTETKVPESDIS